MKGATADDSDKRMRAPNKTMVTTIGVSHHFFRVLRNPQMRPTFDCLAMILVFYRSPVPILG